MKKLISIPIAMLVLTAVAVINLTPPSGRVTLSWQYPTNQITPGLSFNVYTSTNLAIPITNWSVITNVPGTNTSVGLIIEPGAHFFVMTASNFWMESITSNVASTPPLPLPAGDTLKIIKDN